MIQRTDQELVDAAERYLKANGYDYEGPGSVVRNIDNTALVSFFYPGASDPDVFNEPPDMVFVVDRNTFKVEPYSRWIRSDVK